MGEIIKGIDCGDNVKEITTDEDCRILQMENETGEGTMTIYEVFPGAVLVYNDFHMAYCKSKFQANNIDIFCIDHCREGSMEYNLNNDFCYYFEAGDLVVDNRQNHAGLVKYPLKHFHGISIGFYLPQADEQLAKEIKDFSVSLYALQEKFYGHCPYIIKASAEIERIFSDLYRVPAKIKKEYFRIKVLELLLYLDALEFDEQKKDKPYFYKTQVEKIKAIHKLMTEDLTKHYTIEELARRFDMSQATLKKCFKAVYGSPVKRFMQDYRVNTATTMLLWEKEKSIAEIAGLVGYDSPSKFSAVFKKIVGFTPLDYRKRHESYYLKKGGRYEKEINN